MLHNDTKKDIFSWKTRTKFVKYNAFLTPQNSFHLRNTDAAAVVTYVGGYLKTPANKINVYQLNPITD